MSLDRRKLWTIARVTVSVATLIDAFWYWHIWNVYYDILPRSPDKASGRVYVDNFHGIAIYETYEERRRLQVLDYSSEALTLIILSGAAVHTWRAGRTKARPK